MGEDTSFISHKFFIQYNWYEKTYMYTAHKDGTYAKTFHKDGEVKSEYISYEEYASALAHLTLRSKP